MLMIAAVFLLVAYGWATLESTLAEPERVFQPRHSLPLSSTILHLAPRRARCRAPLCARLSAGGARAQVFAVLAILGVAHLVRPSPLGTPPPLPPPPSVVTRAPPPLMCRSC
jgi:hypothetical protein